MIADAPPMERRRNARTGGQSVWSVHGDFPQQNTFDLWYDEAQFESYRRLGEESGKVAIATGRI